MEKGGSKLLTAIISFLLGFLFAILVEVGAVFGVGYYVLNKDLDSLLGTVGIQNTDEDGNKKYINTDTENGGVKNLKELFSGLQGLVYRDGEVVALGKSFDDFSNLIPATDMLLGMVYGVIDDYIELDKEEFESTPLSGLAQVLSDSIMGIRTAALMEKLNVESVTGEDASKLVKTLLMGAETEYATVRTGGPAPTADEVEPAEEQPASTFKLPVFYDIYTYDDEIQYAREMPVNGVSAYPSNFGDDYGWLELISEKQQDGEFVNKRYKLYYVPCRVTETGIEEAEYINGVAEFTEGTGESARTYKLQVLEFGGDTDFIVVKRGDDGEFVIDYDAVYASLENYSYYEPYARNYYYFAKSDVTEKQEVRTICGKNYFRNNADEMVQIDALTLSDIVSENYAQDLTLGEVMDIKSTDNMLLKSLKDTPISGLSNKVKTLTIDEIFTEEEISSNSMLRQLRGTKINELATAMDELLIQTVYADEVYGLPDGDRIMEVVDFDASYKYYTLEKYTDSTDATNPVTKFKFVLVNEGAAGEGELTQSDFDNRGDTVYYTYGNQEGQEGAEIKILFDKRFLFFEANGDGGYDLTEVRTEGLTGTAKDDEMGKLEASDFTGRGDKKYYSYGTPQGMWKLVLFKNKTEKGYTVNNFNNMVNVCANNVNYATLLELREAGILNSTITDAQLAKKLPGQTKTLGELTLRELIDAVISIAS